ncbi:MAG TPA: SH3 domain-containing protein [Baekduia sp.]
MSRRSMVMALPLPGATRRAGVVVLALAAALVAPGVAPAAPRTAAVCASSAGLFETPGGAKVGVVHRGDHVRVVAVGADDGWWRVVARFGTRGWIRETAICRRDR